MVRAFAARNDQAVESIRGRAAVRTSTGSAPGSLERLRVRLEIALQRQHADSSSTHRYQPRVCSSSASGSFEISRPGIAMPRSSLASSSFSGSL